MIKMRDLTGKNLLWNLPVRNPTQTAYTRFSRTPRGGIHSAFSDAQEAWALNNPLARKELDTPFSSILGPLVLGEEE